VLVGSRSTGGVMAPGAIGLSVEVSSLAAGELSRPSGNFAAMMRLLGRATLRVGGNSADHAFWTSAGEAPPAWAESTITPAHLGALGELARATGWRVILTVNLARFDPPRAGDEAWNAARLVGSSLAGIEVGNEPDLYPGHHRPKGAYGYPQYATELAAYRAAIRASAPAIPIIGLSSAKTTWLSSYAREHWAKTSELNQHVYALHGCAGRAYGIRDLLAARVRTRGDELLEMLARVESITKRPVNIGETNSISCAGGIGVSPTFGGSLWALDWALRATRAGVDTIQFHDLLGMCSLASYSPLCATDSGAAAAGRFSARPAFYALITARALEGGAFLPVSVHGSRALTAYATRTPSRIIRLVLVNLATGDRDQRVVIRLPGRFSASRQLLRASGLSVRSHVTLGGGTIDEHARWHPRPRPRRAPSMQVLKLRLPYASAALVILKPTVTR
jgi:hypothetical protein